MMKYLKKIKLVLALIAFYSIVIATPIFSQKINIIGSVIEKSTKQPIPFSTILIADTVTKKPIIGTTSLLDGSFSLETNATNFYIEVSFIGFTSFRFDDKTALNGVIDLGNIILSEDSQQLNEVVIKAAVSKTVFKLNKRIFYVGADITNSGSSALDILTNVPSVDVTIQGQISLRGSTGVQILINGKPSALSSEQGNTLGTLTGDMIEKIEVITNPSAKYDAEGTAGIINIILKKENKEGINGSITLNTGTPDNHSLGFSLNKRTEKLNLFSQIGVGYRSFPTNNSYKNIDYTENTTLTSTGKSYLNESFFNIILGTDYYFNELNVLTLSGHYAYEIESQPSNTEFNFYNSDNSLIEAYKRIEQTTANNPKYMYELHYKKDFKRHKDQSLLFSALGDFFKKVKDAEFTNEIITGDLENIPQKNSSDYKVSEFTFKLDYTHPFSTSYVLEIGSQYLINNVVNDFSVVDKIDNEWETNTDLTNIFNFDQNILGFYSTLAYESDTWGIKAGLRMENTNQDTQLENTNTIQNQNYTKLFPSIHSSYKFDTDFSLQAGYSKRISRPSLWDLNPFKSIKNDFNVYTGNPYLEPEYTDSFEITSIHTLNKSFINWAIFYRYTQNVIEQVTFFEENISTFKPENIGTNKATGLELNAKYSPFKWFRISSDTSFSYYSRNGDYLEDSFDFKSTFWITKLTNKFKLPSDFDIEISGRYRSKYKSYQTENLDNFYIDLGFRKIIIKGKVVLNLSIRDVFETRIDTQINKQPGFYVKDSYQKGRFITFGLSYGFGKGEAMQFSGQKMF